MRISSANIGMESARSYASVYKQSISYVGISYRKGLSSGLGSFSSNLSGTGQGKNKKGQTLSDAMGQMRSSGSSMAMVKRTGDREELRSHKQIKQKCIQYLLEILFRGKRGLSLNNENDTQQGDNQSGIMLFGQKQYEYSESESTSFNTTGKVVTEDGREIEFGLSMEMSRSFRMKYEENYFAGFVTPAVCDPLVINLEGNIAGLSDQKFLFDLDCDGEEDNISTLKAGSGFLAIDKNGDGIINDGSELFGTKSGDGFKDLAAYDEDGNGWIDENDSIFRKLMIWTKDENGNDQLFKLTDKGVGAICLKNVSTQFSLNSTVNNQADGYIRSSGVFLFEDGKAGTVQHLDIAK